LRALLVVLTADIGSVARALDNALVVQVWNM